MTTREVDLLDAIVAAAPDDIAPRLVYADWLTSRDDPRGEFIVVQSELAKLGVETVDAFVEWDETDREKLLRVANLLRRQTQILEAQRQKQQQHSTLPRVGNYRRGFPTSLTAYFNTTLESLMEVANEPHPPFESLSLWSVPERVLEAVPQTLLRNVQTLDLRGPIPPKLLTDVLEYGRLTELRVGDCKDADITPIVERGKNLTSLSLSDISFGPAAFERLMRAPCMQSMRSIMFERVDAFREGANIAALFTPHIVPRLERLWLENIDVGAHAFDSLKRVDATTRWRCPKHIQFNVVESFDSESLATLLTHTDVTALESLTLEFSTFTDAALESIAACKSLGRLKALAMRPYDNEAFSARGVAALATSMSARLSSLSLYLNELFTEASFDALLTRHAFQTLSFETATHLKPSHPAMTTASFAPLATNANASHLRSLTLSGFDLRGLGVDPIATSPYLRALRRLRLDSSMNAATAYSLAVSSMTDVADLDLHSLREGAPAIHKWCCALPFLQAPPLHSRLAEREQQR